MDENKAKTLLHATHSIKQQQAFTDDKANQGHRGFHVLISLILIYIFFYIKGVDISRQILISTVFYLVFQIHSFLPAHPRL